jgi:hypothetical protein
MVVVLGEFLQGCGDLILNAGLFDLSNLSTALTRPDFCLQHGGAVTSFIQIRPRKFLT